MRHLVQGLGFMALGVPMTAHAAETVDAVARGLEAQYQAALIRERRLADDRENQLISEYERQLREARTRFDAGGAGAEARLSEARAQYSALVEQVALRDAASRAEVEAYRAEARGLAIEATPERLAALQRFADGDRVGARPVLDAIRIAQDRAADARSAERWREDAELIDIMRINGEATATEVLAMWEHAADLDPRDFGTHIVIAGLARQTNDLPRAVEAVTAAFASARDGAQRSVAAAEAGANALLSNDLPEAERHFLEAYELAMQQPQSVSQIIFAMDVAQRLGDAFVARNDLSRALEILESALEVMRQLQSGRENEPFLAHTLASHLIGVGDVLTAMNELEDALEIFEEALEISRRLSAASPSNSTLTSFLAMNLSRTGGVLRMKGDLTGAMTVFEEVLELSQGIARADPSDAAAANNLAASIVGIGDVFMEQEEFSFALSRYQEALSIQRRLMSSEASNSVYARALSMTYNKVGSALLGLGQIDGAIQQFEAALAITRPLSDRNSEDLELLRDVAVSLAMIGDVRRGRNDFGGALAVYREAHDISHTLFDLDNQNASRARDEAAALADLASIPGSNVQWSQVVEFLEDMDRHGHLLEGDRHFLQESRRRAAQEPAH